MFRFSIARGSAILILAVEGICLAVPLNPGETQWKTHVSVPFVPKYTSGLPAYIQAGNLVDSLNSPMDGDFAGTVTSLVYRQPDNELTFVYRYTRAQQGDLPGIRRATIGGWENVTITDVGADSSGQSGTGDPLSFWLDGDPEQIDRDPFTEGLTFQWGTATSGSLLRSTDFSSLIWVETTATTIRPNRTAILDTAFSAGADILAPIPEPATAVLSVLLVGLAARSRRR